MPSHSVADTSAGPPRRIGLYAIGVPRYKLLIAYDGTDFCGWQKQEPLARGAAVDGAVAAALAEDDAQVAGGTSAARAGHPAYSEQTPLIESRREGRVALRTVQGVVEQAVRAVVREDVELLGASRTDSGVHARGQVAAFTCEPRETPGVGAITGAVAAAMAENKPEASETAAPRGAGWPIERGVDRLCAAINSRLPEDVLVLSAAHVPVGFDPIGGAVRKAYSYTWHIGRGRPLWDRRTVTHVWNARSLDVSAMNEAAARLVGEHDFAAFASAGHGRLTTVRRVFRCEVREMPRALGRDAGRYQLWIEGGGFLWNMVRIIAGTLLEVGTGRRAADDVGRVLGGRDRTKAGPTAGPEGLCLEWIEYPSGAGEAVTAEAEAGGSI